MKFRPNQTTPNLVIVTLSANGKIDPNNAVGNVGLIADGVGYYAAT